MKSTNLMKNKKLYYFARIISTLFIPPLNLFAVIIYSAFQLENSASKQTQIIAISFIFTLLAPITYFILMLKRKKIVNQDATKREERTIPYIVGILFLLSGSAFLLYYEINQILIVFWFTQVINSVFLIVVNYYWKISAHLIGFTSSAAFLYFLTGNHILLPILLILVSLSWSRYYLKCHTFSQIIAGTIFGFGLTYVQLVTYLGIR